MAKISLNYRKFALSLTVFSFLVAAWAYSGWERISQAKTAQVENQQIAENKNNLVDEKTVGEIGPMKDLPSVMLKSSGNDFVFFVEPHAETPVVFNPTPQNENEFIEQVSKRIATVTSGSLKGAELFRVNYNWESRETCYPVYLCHGNGIYRYLKFGQQIVLLKNASVQSLDKHHAELRDHFKTLGLDLVKDDLFKVPGIFLEKKIIFRGNPRMKLNLLGETESLDLKNYSLLLDHEVAGPILKIDPSNSFEIIKVAPEAVAKFGVFSSSVYVSKSADETYAIYSFEPDIYRDHKVSDSIPYRFSHLRGSRCSEKRPADFIDVLADQSLSEKDLNFAARAVNGDALYFPPGQTLKNLYEFYKLNKSEVINMEDGSVSNRGSFEVDSEAAAAFYEPDSFEDFMSMSPMVIWKNPFGQWMGFVRERFLSPELCD